ncbi:MAG TPA: hypothetical protein VN669_09585 [Candidatus Acidoferrales bacterium]|nr:hypothetical protein [Candidatus Acidoferrales bacterium]
MILSAHFALLALRHFEIRVQSASNTGGDDEDQGWNLGSTHGSFYIACRLNPGAGKGQLRQEDAEGRKQPAQGDQETW